MTEQALKAEATAITEEQVIDYLRSNTTFFVDHDYLLNELTVPHQSGAAISLGERQVQVFRERRDDLQHKLDELISVARENDEHFEKSKRLLLNLLEIKSLDEVQYVVQEAFKNDAKIDFSNVVVFGESTDYPVSDVQLLDYDSARSELGSLMDSTKAICGRFNARQLASLFPENHAEVGSAAIIPLRNGEALGMFCLASRDSAHFDSSMGSLFLSYISDFISRILPDLLQKTRSQKVGGSIPSLLD